MRRNSSNYISKTALFYSTMKQNTMMFVTRIQERKAILQMCNIDNQILRLHFKQSKKGHEETTNLSTIWDHLESIKGNVTYSNDEYLYVQVISVAVGIFLFAV